MAAPTPQEIARQAVKLLTERKRPPTPDNFQAAYHEVAGTKPLQPFPLEQMRQLTSALPETTPGQTRLKAQVTKAVRMHNWDELQRSMASYFAVGMGTAPSLLTSAPANASIAVVEESQFPPELLEQMARIVDHALPAVGNDDVRLAEQATDLVNYLRLGRLHPPSLRKMMADFAFRLSFSAEEQAAIRSLLLNLLHTVFDHIAEISPDNPWLQTQMAALVKAAEPPLNTRRLESLQRQLQDVVHKQADAKARTLQAQALLKQTLGTFIERLGDMSSSSGQYQAQFEQCAAQLEQATSLDDMAPALQNVIQATRTMAVETHRVGEELSSLRDRSHQADAEIQRLQSELDRLSNVVSHDMLTGALNRKGLEDVMQKEMLRSVRSGTQVCLALLDIDNFKRINDEHGHATGDAALQHLTQVAQESLRPQDAVARYGGEEFVIVLPETEIEEAEMVLSRLQRQLTTNYFLQDEKKLLITFSAGVAQVMDNETSAQTLERADRAMYVAKRSGKNRVVRG